MSLSTHELQKIARLARLSLSDEELNRLGEDLSRIVNFVDQLAEVDVSDVEPMSHAGDRSLVFRDDFARPGLGRRAIDASAGYEDGLIRVPKIVE